MMLLPREIDKMYVSSAAEIARRRKARGLKLNLPEAVALIANYIVEGARDGKSVVELMSEARTVLKEKDVLPEIPQLLKTVQVEATFPDGTKLVTVHDPISSALKSSAPGRYLLAGEPVEANRGRKTFKMIVRNTGDRPIQVGSHYHFMEVNRALYFDRARAFGFRLNIPAGTAVRFEPGDSKEVELVELGGRRVVHGFHGLVEGSIRSPTIRARALREAKKRGFAGA
jgi:urease subunit gamma/beta